MTDTVTPISVAVLGPAQLYAVPGSRAHKPYIIAFLSDTNRGVCACPATVECWHVREARQVHDRLEARR